MAELTTVPTIKDIQKQCVQSYIELGVKLYDQIEKLDRDQLVHLTNVFSSVMELSSISKVEVSLTEKDEKDSQSEIEMLKLEIQNLKSLVDINVDFSLEERKSRKKLKEQVKTLTAQHQLVTEKLAATEAGYQELESDFDEHQEEIEELAQIILDRLDKVENTAAEIEVKVDDITFDIDNLYDQYKDVDEVDQEDEEDEEVDQEDEEVDDEDEEDEEVDDEDGEDDESSNPASEIVDEAFKYIYAEYLKNEEETNKTEESNETEEHISDESEDEEYYPLEDVEEIQVNQVEIEVEDENKYSVEWSEEDWSDEAVEEDWNLEPVEENQPPVEETTIEWEPVFAENTVDTSNVPEFSFNAPNEEFDYNYLPPETPLSLPSLEESTPLFKYKNF